jgi:amino acid permease
MIIEIALGIVLAVVILSIWPWLLAGGVILICIAAVGVALLYAFSVFASQPQESKEVFGIIITVVGVIALVVWAIHDDRQRKHRREAERQKIGYDR